MVGWLGVVGQPDPEHLRFPLSGGAFLMGIGTTKPADCPWRALELRVGLPECRARPNVALWCFLLSGRRNGSPSTVVP